MVPEQPAFDRDRFQGLSSTQLSAERDELRAQLGQQAESSIDREARRARIEAAVQSASRRLEKRFADLAAEAAETGSLTEDSLSGVAELWLLARVPELAEALHAAAGEPAASREQVAAERKRLRSEIAAREAELVLRVAEEQLGNAGMSLDPLLAERLVQQVLSGSDHDADSGETS